MDFERKRITDSRDRRAFIGGSDARTIMGDDEQALLRLWREKRGEGEPEDLSGNLVVQLGAVTEDLNRRRYELNTGLTVGDVQKRVKHPILRWMGATLDGVVEGTGALFESKFMLPWKFSEEGQHNECQARRSLTGHLSFFGALPLGFRNRTPRPPPVSSRNSIQAASIAFLQLGLGIVRYPRASAAARERLLAELTGVVLDSGATAAARQDPSAVCRQTTLPGLRKAALRPPSSEVRAIPRSRTKGQRRIHGPALPGASPRTAPRRQGSGLVGANRDRADWHCRQALDRDPPATRPRSPSGRFISHNLLDLRRNLVFGRFQIILRLNVHPECRCCFEKLAEP